MGKILTKFYNDITTDSSGVIMAGLIGGSASRNSGYIKQIVATVASGSATLINVQVRYFQNDSSSENLVYKFNSGIFPFVDSEINAPFSLNASGAGTDLYLYVDVNSLSTLNLRVDFELDI